MNDSIIDFVGLLSIFLACYLLLIASQLIGA